MRQAIGTTWIYQLVIIFILIFVSFLLLTLTYSKSYKTKNEIIDIIEKHEGINETSVAVINNYLYQSGYRYTHKCPNPETSPEWLGADSLETNKLEAVEKGKKYYYCIRRHLNSQEIKGSRAASNRSITKYYEVQIFFKFNLPIIENVGTFTTNGSTNDMFKTNNDMFDKIFYSKKKGSN